MPAVLDTEDGGLYVTKFRGAGQGAKALVAEILVTRIAELLELPVPSMALIELDQAFGKSERDPEIQDILKGSRGINVGHRLLDGAFNFDPASDTVEPELATRIVWLDAFTTNLDRTARNPNLMWWQDGLWLIDHGAALYFHHGWSDSWTTDWDTTGAQRAVDRFAAIRDHVLLSAARDLESTDRDLAGRCTASALADVVDQVPDELLMDAPTGTSLAFPTALEHRAAYRRYFETRLAEPRAFVTAATEAIEAQSKASNLETATKSYRR